MCNRLNIRLLLVISCFQWFKDNETRPISDGFRKNNVNYWAFREIRSIIPHL